MNRFLKAADKPAKLCFNKLSDVNIGREGGATAVVIEVSIVLGVVTDGVGTDVAGKGKIELAGVRSDDRE